MTKATDRIKNAKSVVDLTAEANIGLNEAVALMTCRYLPRPYLTDRDCKDLSKTTIHSLDEIRGAFPDKK